eukprot:243600_1
MEFDLDMFKQDGEECFDTKHNEMINITECDHTYRLITALRYYTCLITHQNQYIPDIFGTFCSDVYHELMNDWIHFILTHSEQLSQINKQLSKCVVEDCEFVHRYINSGQQTKHKAKDDSKFAFYVEIMDQIHLYLFHLYDLGLRFNNSIFQEAKTNEKNNNTDPNNQQYECIDYQFGRMRDFISNKRKQFGFEAHRFQDTHNKYNIITQHLQTDQHISFLDAIFTNLKDDGLSYDTLNVLQIFIKDDEYDTDAFIEDIQCPNLNISQIIKNDKFMKLIKKYVKYFKLKSHSFNSGLMFYYWSYYKEISEGKRENPKDVFWNIVDFGEDAIGELYVAQKYNTFKEEILTHINIEMYANKVILRAEHYIRTKKAKEMTNNREDDLHYAIKYGTPISIHNLISVILYCNFSDLSKDFSATFRAIRPFESLKSIKNRNREYWWLSKILKETVQYFGNTRNKRKGDIEVGPFYCGINAVMNIPSFSIRLCSPTSTSKNEEIAVNFATKSGMIIELNNDGSSDSDRIRSFDCSWLSVYSYERERLFMGGDVRIRIESIKIIETLQNFHSFMHALYVLDCMVNGASLAKDGFKINKKDITIIKMLQNKDERIDKYVVNTFAFFCNMKKQVIINLCYLHRYFQKKKASKLIIHSLQETGNNEVFSMHETSSVNLLNQEVFYIFGNVEKIRVYSTDFRGRNVYKFSMIAFLYAIRFSSSWKTIEILAACDGQYNNQTNDFSKHYKPSWIHKIWSTSASIIAFKYKQKGFRISLQTGKNSDGYCEDCLTIERINKVI